MSIMNFKTTSSCCTIVDRKDHVQYLQFQRAIPDDVCRGNSHLLPKYILVFACAVC